MKKRIFAFLLALSLLCLCFVSCASEDDQNTNPDDGNKTTTLANEQFDAASTVTDYVKLNVSFTNKQGIKRNADIVVELNAAAAPITVKNFQDLVKSGFYNGLTFHRIIEGFMIQGGDPQGTGMGGSGNPIKGEFMANGISNPIKHTRGVISMARSKSYDSASSQFFIVHQTSAHLDGQYAAFGAVVFGMDAVDEIASIKTDANDKPEKNVVINSATFVTPKGQLATTEATTEATTTAEPATTEPMTTQTTEAKTEASTAS